MTLTVEKKQVTGSILIILSMATLIGVIYLQAATQETITGEIDIVNQSRVPVIIDWFDPDILIPHMGDAQFYCEIYDIDNESTELTVTLYYSRDHWELHNASIVMTFSHMTATHQSYFTYLWPGEPERTYYQYYYQVTDGNATVKKPSEIGIYFDIQWDLALGDVDITTLGYWVPLIDPVTLFIDIFLVIVLIIFVMFLVNRRRNRYNRKSR